VLFYDITESKRAEEAIRASEERYRVFLELSNEGIWRFELDEPVRVDLPAESQVSEIFRNAWLAECNRAMARMYGYESADEIVGKRLTEFLDMADPRNLKYLEAFVREGFRLENMESHETDRDGRILIFENSLVGHLEPGPGGVRRLLRAWGTQRDVTAQRNAEAALRQSEERYRSLFESIDEGFCILEVLFGEDGTPLDYRFVQTNPAFERLTGLDGAQDQLMLALQPKIDPFWVETYGRVARTRQAERFVKESRGLGKWLSVYAFPTGEPAERFVAVLITDITEQKLAEEELRAASTLKDEFLGLVSHELRTPLTVIRGSASLLNRYGDLPDSTRGEIIQDLIKESDRLNRVVENMLALGRLQAGEKPPTEPLLVSRAIERAVERFLEDQELNRIRIGPTPRGAIVLGVEGYVEQILHNFLSNAYKYSPADTTVTVLARQEGGFVRISVADRGRGLVKPAALFAPFYRDPESSRTTPGLGLGLAVSKRLVEAMGGQISGKARRGGGSVFSFTLPLQAAETQDD
jgi:PAS domain S-box-containing protein